MRSFTSSRKITTWRGFAGIIAGIPHFSKVNTNRGEPKEKPMTLPVESIVTHIQTIRGQRVILDADLAEMYGVTTGALNQAVKRNEKRFPEDFMFRLNLQEVANLKSQIVTSRGWGGRRRALPAVFTERGVAMLSSVLNSERAVQVNIAIMRAFVALRQVAVSHASLSRRLNELEQKYDSQFKIVFDAIRELMEPPKKKRRKIGF